MTEHPPEAAWWDDERNGWISPDGVLVPAELVGGRDLPEQTGRAEPFGITYEVDDVEACTCDVETTYLHDGRPFVTTRTPDPDNLPCPILGHDQPEAHRH